MQQSQDLHDLLKSTQIKDGGKDDTNDEMFDDNESEDEDSIKTNKFSSMYMKLAKPMDL